MRRLFFRCRYGHFICGGCCPIDAWTHEKLDYAVSLFSQNPSMGIEELANAGIGSELTRRMLIIESLAFPASVDFIYPKYYKTNGIIDEDIEREW